MKYKISLLLLLVLTSCSTSKMVNSKTIFRHIDLGQYGRIEIGDDITRFRPLIETRADRFYLKENVFGGSNSIELLIDKSNKVSAMIFEYGSKVDLESKISEYKYLGKPKLENDSAVWNDGKTQFSIYERNGSVYSKIKGLK